MNTPSLGARIWFAKKKITDYCIEAKEQKQIYKYQKRQFCCSKNSEVGQYGCYKPCKKKKKWKFRKTNFKKYDNKSRYFRKRKFSRYNRSYSTDRNSTNKLSSNQSYKSPKKCTCFICKEEGHYANQCPKSNKQNIKILDQIYEYGFEPVESEIDSDYSLYSASINSEELSDDE